MYNPLSLFLGLRYVTKRQGGGFTSFVSASSTVGIALGVFVLIVVLSAMNGFEKALAKQLLSIVPHAELESVNKPIPNWKKYATRIEQHESIEAVAPVIKLQGMLQKGKALKGVELRGVDLALEAKVSNIDSYIVDGSWQGLSKEKSIALGKVAADKLKVSIGDTVEVLLPPAKQDISRSFAAPVMKSFVVSAIFSFSAELDAHLAYINYVDAAQILNIPETSTQTLRLKVSDVFNAPKVAMDAGYSMTHAVYIRNWTHTQGHIYNDIQLVRLVMYIVLVLVIAVASFNIVSTLFMAVNEKQSDIAILKTMGAKNSTIMTTFVYQGVFNGAIGCLFGVVLGSVFALNMTAIIGAIEKTFNTQLMKGNVYFIDHIPSHLLWSDVIATACIAFTLSILATIFPAWRATKIEPAVVLGQS